MTQLKVLKLGAWASPKTPYASNSLDNHDLPQLGMLINLIELDLSHNKISDLSYFTQNPLRTLSSLNLSENFELVDISPLTNLSNLNSLDISYTNVANIAPLQRLTASLETLKLDGSQVVDFKTLFSLRGLKNLGVSDSNFKESDLRYLPLRLESLDLSWLFLSNYQLLQRIAPRLDTLYLTGTLDQALRTLPHFPNLRALDIAYVGAGRDQDFIDNIARQTSLEILNLDTNWLATATFLNSLTKLTAVNMENNNLDRLDFMSNLTELDSIWLYNNSRLDPTFCPSLNGDPSLCHYENSVDLQCAGSCKSEWQKLWNERTTF